MGRHNYNLVSSGSLHELHRLLEDLLVMRSHGRCVGLYDENGEQPDSPVEWPGMDQDMQELSALHPHLTLMLTGVPVDKEDGGLPWAVRYCNGQVLDELR